MSNRKFFLFNPVNYRVKKIFILIAFFIISNFLIVMISSYYIKQFQDYEIGALKNLESSVQSKPSEIKVTVQNYINDIEKRQDISKRFFSGYLVITMILTSLLFLLVVSIFSKIIGPVHHINLIVKKYLSGEEVQFRNLRDGDEFVELYKNIAKLIKKENLE